MDLSTPAPRKSSMSPNDLKLILWQYENNRSITDGWHYAFLSLYIIIGSVAFFANGLVVLAVFRNKKVRTPRNMLIFHLAVTDLALAATIPLSAIDALSKYWPWGHRSNWLCKISRSAPTTLVFMVSFIIIVIACDRYRCIVRRNHVQMTRSGAIIMLPIAFVVASFVSIPLFIHSQVVVPEVSKMSPNLSHVVFCMENWDKKGDPSGENLTHRGIYSIVVAVFQYLLPLLIVLVIYATIYRFLLRKQYPRHLRQNKTNSLLASISITHCIIWLPFSLFNILADLWPDKLFNNDQELMIKVYCAVHLVGLFSTCTNPVLYAFFNENLRKEFEFMLECICPTRMFRTQTSQRSLRTSPNQMEKQNEDPLNVKQPRRDERVQHAIRTTQCAEIDDIELDPTFHKETGVEEDCCGCFKEVEEGDMPNNGGGAIEMTHL